jgi:hypothetical protein
MERAENREMKAGTLDVEHILVSRVGKKLLRA